MKKGAYCTVFVLKNDILYYHLSYEKIDVCHSCNRGWMFNFIRYGWQTHKLSLYWI